MITIEFTKQEIEELIQNYDDYCDESYSLHTADMIYKKLKELNIIKNK